MNPHPMGQPQESWAQPVKGRYLVETWGCQMNDLDGQKMAGALEGMGYVPVTKAEQADIILLNTCSVRDKAEKKLFDRLGRLRELKEQNGTLLCVMGCVAQQEGEAVFRRAPFVDLVAGPRALVNLPYLIEEARRQQMVDTTFYDEAVLYDKDRIARPANRRAFVTVMEGCDKSCAYCIVPRTRGAETFRPYAHILDEVKSVVDKGVIEIEVLGQNVNAWRWEQKRFPDLLEAISNVPGVQRLRFTTSHPAHYTDALTDLMAERANICKFLHLPFQAGSNDVLKAMNRGYKIELFLKRIEYARARMPRLALSTDVIVGFPGETEAQFRESLQVLKGVAFDNVYAFIYSPRPGTAALQLEDPVSLAEKKERLSRLLDGQAYYQEPRYKAYEGEVHDVLVDGPAKYRKHWLRSKTDTWKVVNFDAHGTGLGIGDLVKVKITEAHPNSLRAERLPSAG